MREEFKAVYLPVRFFKKEAYILLEDYKQLREENKRLEEENKKLKEELSKLKEKYGDLDY